MRYLSVDQIVALNGEILRVEGGLRSAAGVVANRNSLEYLIEAVTDDRLYPELADKAALYAFNVITRHVFPDGNKRTGMASAFSFLDGNDSWIDATDDDVVETALRVARGEMSREELIRWFADRIV